MVATSGLGNRLLKTRWFVDDEGLRFRTIHADFHVLFLSLLDHGQGRSQRGTQGGLEGNVTVKRSHEGEARAC